MGVLAEIVVSKSTIALGICSGLSYAMLAVGLVLVYRATRVINFAHGEIGAFGAAVLGILVVEHQWNFFAALAVAIVIGGLVGALVEVLVVRRLFHRPRFVLLIATIGVSQILFFAQAALPSVGQPGPYPTPIQRVLAIDQFFLRSEHFMVLLVVPATIAAVALFLNRHPQGLAIRACAENADAAQLGGISIRRVSTFVWVLAGVLATLTAVLVNPLKGAVVGVPSIALGPGLLLRALVAVLIGRFVSLPWVLAGGIGVGIVEALLFTNVQNPGATDMVLLVIAGVLVIWRGRSMVVDDGSGWFDTSRATADADETAARPTRRLWMGGAVAFGALLPLVASDSSQAFLFSRMLIFALVALSVTVLTGWAGQLSLGQFGFVGLGAMTTAALVDRGMPFGAATLYATVAAAAAAVVVGAPALRVRGPLFAVLTLAFAVAANSWILNQSWFLGDRTLANIPRGSIAGVDLGSQRTYYYLCLAVVVLVALGVGRLRRTGVGRAILAVRDNERGAASYTISPSVAKLTAFGLSGALAGLAGALLGGLQVQFGTDSFRPDLSFLVVTIAVIGGLGTVAGAVLGAVYVLGVPAMFGHSLEVQLLTSGAGLLVLLLVLPGGLVELAGRVRDRALAAIGRRRPPAEVPAPTPATSLVAGGDATPRQAVDADAPVALRAVDIVVRFGGVVALDGVSIEARQGEVVGLMGTNGAGKSTLMDVIGGYRQAQGGRVELFGEDVTQLSAHERARRGMGRVFQDARLFADLTVSETIRLALEHDERSELVPSLLGLGPSRRSERRKRSRAAEVIAMLNLERYANTPIADLSTGTRRIIELAGQIALGSRVLLLDEPTAGVAQKDAEAFGPLIQRVQRDLDATVVLIEHDLPLVLSVSDRVYCLGAGQVIAEGLPDEVRNDPSVISSYLGTDDRTILRSGALAGGAV